MPLIVVRFVFVKIVPESLYTLLCAGQNAITDLDLQRRDTGLQVAYTGSLAVNLIFELQAPLESANEKSQQNTNNSGKRGKTAPATY